MQKDNWNVDHVEIVNTPPPALPHSGTDANLIKTSTSEGTTTLDQKDIEQLFKSRNLAFVSTLSKDGSPHITPVWADFEDDYILINTFETSA
ncbi:MAG: hypothetical protein ACTHKF_02410, partial [Candidatus Nitrosocosmicus sp.]